jgi:gliding motility associated protien GldN
MKLSVSNGILVLLLLFSSSILFAQGTTDPKKKKDDGYNPHSLNPIHKHDQLFKRTLWVRMDCREKINKPFHAKNHELAKVILDGVRAGLVRPFMNDSLITRMDEQTLTEHLTIPEAEAGLSAEEKALGFKPEDALMGGSDAWDEDSKDKKKGEASVSNTYFPKDMYIFEIKMDLIFDKKRSRMYRDIQSVTIIIPAEKNPAKGVDIPIATFSYKELVEGVFADNPEAIWYNFENPGQHMGLAHAFELNLFNGRIVKMENGDDVYLDTMYGNDQRAALIAAEQIKYDLLEFESLLWEY